MAVAVFKLQRLLPGARSSLRFTREAEAIARLRHPHIVRVHDCGSWNFWRYMALEWVEGESLEQRLLAQQHRRQHWQPSNQPQLEKNLVTGTRVPGASRARSWTARGRRKIPQNLRGSGIAAVAVRINFAAVCG